jgi:hypothetical protein
MDASEKGYRYILSRSEETALASEKSPINS